MMSPMFTSEPGAIDSHDSVPCPRIVPVFVSDGSQFHAERIAVMGSPEISRSQPLLIVSEPVFLTKTLYTRAEAVAVGQMPDFSILTEHAADGSVGGRGGTGDGTVGGGGGGGDGTVGGGTGNGSGTGDALSSDLVYHGSNPRLFSRYCIFLHSKSIQLSVTRPPVSPELAFQLQ
mmetsp:Transcript_5259/g.10396  ORF Transcript_5259/g.10396 Transcript_5259/m.10396 type:complete len:175 (-) Transcript_5259:1391-1915(-)